MSRSFRAAFTLIELLVSLAVIALLSLVLISITGQSSDVWRQARSKIDQFRGARDGFESITRRLSQATLNTYLDYYDNKGRRRTQANVKTFAPTSYGRYSELRFVSGPAEQLLEEATVPRPTHAVFFQAPLGFVEDFAEFRGLDNLINTWGYFLEFNSDMESA
ncbi:MAG: prepilin-type N-terminal cleavage/methylation domain-containing protein, partial [Verrucomicrobiota bacterium]|nr:prepilin-type N-terminal cleavage/methylation domain-containing protein [Verrucomicrobiota bacterium]